jgi:hypothetical protein
MLAIAYISGNVIASKIASCVTCHPTVLKVSECDRWKLLVMDESIKYKLSGRQFVQIVSIAKAESSGKQFDEEGNIIKGLKNKYDSGLLQINSLYHLDKAKEMGLDIYTLEGNIKYGVYLYYKEGTAPWLASKAAWNKKRS